jgi:hypothetical protein
VRFLVALPVGHVYLQALKVSFCRECVDDVVLEHDPENPSFKGHAYVVLSSLGSHGAGRAGKKLRDEAAKVSVLIEGLAPEDVFKSLVAACRAYDASAE